MKTEKLIEFTDREQFLIAYYRDPSLSGSRWTGFGEWAVVAGSLGLMALWAATDELFYGIAGYAAVLTRLIAYVARSRQFTDDLRSVLRRYDEKVRTLADAAWMACQRGEGFGER